MKKLSVYFTDPQAAALETMASQAGITFAEALRRALDTWLSHQAGGTMTMSEQTTPVDVTTAYVQLRDEDYFRSWKNADIIEDDYRIEVWRGERKLAQFDKGLVTGWYLEEPA